MKASKNTRRLWEEFRETSLHVKLRGVLGVTQYQPVYESLHPTQKEYLKKITGERNDEFIEIGYFVSIAYAYPDGIVENIGFRKDGIFDKDAWNIYAKWYKYLNNSLDFTSETLANDLKGIPLKATTSGMASHIHSVKEYFPITVSHRVHAEFSGIGWRGKNSLIVNPIYSCMIRLAGIITSQPLHVTQRVEYNCGSCNSCLQACTFLKHMDKLEDYREQCLLYMTWLALDDELCGKCIKACVYSPRFKSVIKSPPGFSPNSLYYT